MAPEVKHVTRTENGDIPLSPLVKKSKGVKLNYVADKNGKLLWDKGVPKNVRDQWQSIYDNKEERLKTSAKEETAKPAPEKEQREKKPPPTFKMGGPDTLADDQSRYQEEYNQWRKENPTPEEQQAAQILEEDPAQRELIKEIRVDEKGNLVLPKGLNPVIAAGARQTQSGFKSTDPYERNYFPPVGQTWEQHAKTNAKYGGHWWEGPLSGLLPTDLRKDLLDSVYGTEGKQLPDIQLLTPEQRALQNQAINQASQQLGQVGKQPTLPNPPTLTPPGPVPQLNFDYPGYKNPQAPIPGFSALSPLSQGNVDIGALEQLARHNFKTKTVPSLAARFAGLGGQNSSAYLGALGSAGTELERELSAMRVQHEERQQRQRFEETYRQNEQQLQRENYLNNLATGQNAQQLTREELQNQLAMGTNTQRLAQQAQGAQQGLQFGQLQTNLYGTQAPNVLEQQRQGAQGTLSLLQQGLQPRTEAVYQQPSPGLLQTGAQALAQQLPGIAARYATGGTFGSI